MSPQTLFQYQTQPAAATLAATNRPLSRAPSMSQASTPAKTATLERLIRRSRRRLVRGDMRPILQGRHR
ncbi:hypothetical protein M0638_27675 [Roseomonas sp. NAR14]|uniref:Uncharacterized protein n=1 Tax=Roseomonas acroporae TaxID=2937791 RepID=A0A9X1YFX0_9PROT|nr:hypothetical protein [Roseomonas acroporae]MCK8788138.1 hypothetical protein [Roseomonas acroporae]